MKTLCLPLFLLFSACNPISDAREDCREVAEQALDECVLFYEDVAVPEIQEQLNETIAIIQAWFENEIALLRAQFEQALINKKIEILTELGCTKDPTNSFGWDCANTVVCL